MKAIERSTRINWKVLSENLHYIEETRREVTFYSRDDIPMGILTRAEYLDFLNNIKELR